MLNVSNMSRGASPAARGHHEPIISLEIYEKTKVRKAAKAIVSVRNDINQYFPSSGLVSRARCDKPMSSCWSNSPTGAKHPYCWCQSRDCFMYRKPIRRDDI